MIRAFVMLMILLALTAAMVAYAWAGEVKLAWNANAADQRVTSYLLHVGIDLVATVPATETTATLTLADAPAIVSLRAVNAVGMSEPTTISLIPITIEASANLTTWKQLKTIHRERKAAEFFRLQIQTP